MSCRETEKILLEMFCVIVMFGGTHSIAEGGWVGGGGATGHNLIRICNNSFSISVFHN